VATDIVVSANSGVGEIRIARPAKKNALTTAMYGALADALEAFAADDDIRAALIAGGDDFTAGNDLRDFLAASTSGDSSVFGAVIQFLERLSGFPKPLVVAVRGNAIGIGTTMLLHADVTVAATSARFRLPFAQLGLVPEAGSSLLLPLVVGRSRAAWLLMSGDFFGAYEAFEMGLVTKVVDDREVDAGAREIAIRLARLPPMAVSETKRLMRAPIEEALRRQMDLEAQAFADALNSAEFRTAVANVLSSPKGGGSS
jgi:enoyl-CoA hydratase/carnithine racemase